MSDVLNGILLQLTRIADAMEAAGPKLGKSKKASTVADLLGEPAGRKKNVESAIPEHFPMTEKHRSFAAERGLIGKAAEFEFDSFKSWHGAKGTKYVSWDQAWQTWVLKRARFNGTAPLTRPTNDGMDGRI
jgi:hypothetical protein